MRASRCGVEWQRWLVRSCWSLLPPRLKFSLHNPLIESEHPQSAVLRPFTPKKPSLRSPLSDTVFSCPSTGCVRNGWEFDARVRRLTADKGYRAAFCGTVIYITPIWLAFCNSRLG